jgi:DNA-binding CsgD family transcriptional regulator
MAWRWPPGLPWTHAALEVRDVRSSTVTETDVVALLDLVEQARAADREETFYSSVLMGLRDLIPCDDIAFQLMDVRRRIVSGVCVTDEGVSHDLEDPDPDVQAAFWDAFWADGGCSYPMDRDDYVTILRRSDLHDDREYSRTAMGALMVETGVRHEVLVPLPPRGVIDRRLLLFRSDGPDFSDRDLILLRMVRPHLSELHLRRHRELSGQPALTARQWEILRRVSTGATNGQVARALGVSQATVRKHLENVFVRLQVASRTEAVDHVRAFIDAG